MKGETKTLVNAPNRRAKADPWFVRWILVGLTILIVGVLVIVPLVNVFYEALAKGPRVYWDNLLNKDTQHAMFLTAVVAPTAVFLNVIFGLSAAWVIARFRFPGRAILVTIIDLPFAVSPVV